MTTPVVSFPVKTLAGVVLTYSGLLVVVASAIVGTWSALTSLLTFYLVLVAPVVMGTIAYRCRQARASSPIHQWAYYAGILYCIVVPLAVVTCLLIG